MEGQQQIDLAGPIPDPPDHPHAAQLAWAHAYRDRLPRKGVFLKHKDRLPIVHWCVSHQDIFRANSLASFTEELHFFANIELRIDNATFGKLIGTSGSWVKAHRRLRDEEIQERVLLYQKMIILMRWINGSKPSMAAYVRNRMRRPLSIWKPRTKSSVLRSYKWTWRRGCAIAGIERKCLKLQSKQTHVPLLRVPPLRLLLHLKNGKMMMNYTGQILTATLTKNVSYASVTDQFPLS